MVATPISASARYIPPGTRQYYFVPTIADKNLPTRAELDAGTDLTPEISEVAGFQTVSDSVDTPDLGTRFTSKVPGRITADDSSITMYSSLDSMDVRQVLTRDLAGFVVAFPEGDHATNTMDVFPVKVSSAPKSTGIEDPGTIEVQFTITAVPVENVTVPAASSG